MDLVVTWSFDLVSTQVGQGPSNMVYTDVNLVFQHGDMGSRAFGRARTDLFEGINEFIIDTGLLF